jgi:hypothetical protein
MVTVVVSLVADFGRFNFQTVTTFMRATKVEFTTAPAIKFNTCYQLGVYSWSDINLELEFIFLEISNF